MRAVTLIFISLFFASEHAQSDAPLEPLLAGHRAFAFDLYREIREEDRHLFFSPHSVSMALLMTSAGARGETRQEMLDTLCYPDDAQDLHAAAHALHQTLKEAEAPGHVELHEANGLWPAKGFTLQPDFLSTMNRMYNTDVEALDYSKPVEAAQTINAWIEKQTRDLLKNVVSPDALSPLTRLVLANAIYFKGDWLLPFDEKLTKPAPFHLADGTRKDIPMMRGELAKVSYAKLDDMALLALPYSGRTMSMLIALPDDPDGLSRIEDQLSPALFASWLEALQRRTVHVTLPVFTMTSEFQLNPVLKKLGMTRAFASGRADLSGIGSRPGDLFISDVFHKAYVDVNETGTEAAAVTTVMIRATSVSMDPRFVADKPFLFFIYDHASESILFMGRFSHP
jgi:serpin B